MLWNADHKRPLFAHSIYGQPVKTCPVQISLLTNGYSLNGINIYNKRIHFRVTGGTGKFVDGQKVLVTTVTVNWSPSFSLEGFIRQSFFLQYPHRPQGWRYPHN